MRIIVKTLVIVMLFAISACKNKNGCEDIACFTPPSSFDFELVDKSSGENLFTNGILNPNDIEVINIEDQKNLEFTFIDENDYNIIKIHTIGWKTEIVNYSIQVSSEAIFELYVNAERLNGDCCSYTEYKEVEINGSGFDLNQDSGIYKIFVD